VLLSVSGTELRTLDAINSELVDNDVTDDDDDDVIQSDDDDDNNDVIAGYVTYYVRAARSVLNLCCRIRRQSSLAEGLR